MKFLSAEWRKLAIFNYEVDPKVLEKYLPIGVELDYWEDKCYVSIVGFMFLKTKLLGVPVPFHRNFEEVNLRFYVKKFENNEWKRGVVFVQELVPKVAIELIANTIYNEHYKTLPMKHSIETLEDKLKISYSWKINSWNSVQIEAENTPQKIVAGSEFDFITEHYFGYTKNKNTTTEYEVQHPKWDFYQVTDFKVDLDFEENYGEDFEFLNHQRPNSVMLAEGSEVAVLTKTFLS